MLKSWIQMYNFEKWYFNLKTHLDSSTPRGVRVRGSRRSSRQQLPNRGVKTSVKNFMITITNKLNIVWTYTIILRLNLSQILTVLSCVQKKIKNI